MPRYMNMKDNEDGTMLVTTNVSGEEQTFIIPVDFNMVIAGFGEKTFAEAQVLVKDMMVEIPNHI